MPEKEHKIKGVTKGINGNSGGGGENCARAPSAARVSVCICIRSHSGTGGKSGALCSQFDASQVASASM